MLRSASTRQTTPASGARSWAPATMLCLLGALMLPMTSPAAEPTRIGYVDMKRLFDNAPQVLAAREALDQEFRPRNEALLADENRLEDKQGQLAEQTDLDAEARFQLEREIRNLRRSIDRRREDLSEELRFRTSAEKKALEEIIEIAVRQVAEAGDFALVLTSPVAYAAPSIDITDQILEWLEDDRATRSSGARR